LAEMSGTVLADNFPVQVDLIENGIRLTAPVEKNGVQKKIEILLEGASSKVFVKHTLINKGITSVSLAPWALSVMRPGGVAIIPQAKRIDFPVRLTPTHSLALWGYTRMIDNRWTWGDRYIFLRQDSNAEKPQKFGIYDAAGWAAYSSHGDLFIKEFTALSDVTYPDFNCNFEAFTNNKMLEMESLGPLQVLAPGCELQHDEVWSLYSGIPQPDSDVAVDRDILPLIHA
jgi:hypothetical protein